MLYVCVRVRVRVQEAGIADKAVPMALRFRGNGKKLAFPVLSIMDPGQEPEPFDDWDLGNAQVRVHARRVGGVPIYVYAYGVGTKSPHPYIHTIRVGTGFRSTTDCSGVGAETKIES